MRFASSASNSEMSRNVSTCRSGRTRRWTGAFGLMSSTATNPSAALTCSPSRTSVQKRQSGCEANDSLLRDVVGPYADELTLRRLDEPRRVVVAVASARPVDEDGFFAAQLPGPPPPAGFGGESTEPHAPLLLHSVRNAIVVCGSSPRPRRVREHVHLRHPGLLDGPERVLERGFVLGREADDHVGRQVEFRRLLDPAQIGGDVIPPAHRPEDAVVARLERDVQMAGDRRGLAHCGHERVAQVIDLDGGQPEPFDPRDRARLADEARKAESGLAVAVAAEVDPRENDLPVPLPDAARDLAENRPCGTAARRAAHVRDHAEVAGEAATVLDLHEGAHPLEPHLSLHTAEGADRARDRARGLLAREPYDLDARGKAVEGALEIRGAAGDEHAAG